MTTPSDISMFTPAAHGDVLALILQIGLLLLTARFLGEVAQRFNQPPVIGEIMAGILLGPSMLGFIFPGLTGYVIPGNEVQGYLLEAVSLIGAIFLLLITGLETDLKLIRQHARTALGVSFGGITVTFLSGFLLGQNLPDVLLVDSDARLIFSLFLATAMSISAIPVIAKVLIDLDLTRRDIGQTIIAAGMSDDTVGWILLSIVAGLASGEAVSGSSVAVSVGTVLGFLFFSFTLGRHLVKWLFNLVQDRASSRDRLLTLVVVLTFLWGSVTQLLHLEAVLGAFVMGILFAQIPRLPHEVPEKLHSIALSVFAPIFFATAGLKVNAIHLLRPDLLAITALVITIACGGKIIGTYLGARLIGGKDHWSALSFGAALNARGAMEIIIATIGLSLGILSQEMFSIIVVMAMTTSLITPAALRWVLRKVHPSEEEALRLKQEELTEDSSIIHIHRVLMPVRQRRDNDHLRMMQLIKSRLLHNIGMRNDLSVTLMSIERKANRAAAEQFLKEVGKNFREHELITKTVDSDKVIPSVLSECAKEYELLVLGAPARCEDPRFIFSEILDELIKTAPCNTMIVYANTIPRSWSPTNILVPTNGSTAARNAVELALMIAATGLETVKIINVIEQDSADLHAHMQEQSFRRRLKVAADMLKPMRELGRLKNVPTEVEAKAGPSPEKTIIDVCRDDGTDLLVIGTDVRPASNHLFLGPRVEYLLRHAPCPVVILNSV